MEGKKLTAVVIVLSLLAIEWFCAYYYFNKPVKEIVRTDTIIQTKRDSLLQIINDTTVEVIEREYEKNINSLLTQPVDSQCKFFSNYLSKNSGRFSYSDNSDSVKGN